MNLYEIKIQIGETDSSLPVTFLELKYLVEVLREHLGTQRQGIYHADISSFKEEMKQEERMLRSLIEKLKVELLKPIF